MNSRTLLAFLTTSIICLSGCSSDQPISERSIDDLSQAGYYVYIFPDVYETQFDWKRVVKLSSFNKQCSGFFSEDTWNPINITYANNRGNTIDIRISPQDAIWDMSQSAESIVLDVSWIPTRQGEYYLNETNQTIIKAKDTFGIDVIFTSSLSPDALSELIQHLEYIGPNPTTVSDPWQAACGT